MVSSTRKTKKPPPHVHKPVECFSVDLFPEELPWTPPACIPASAPIAKPKPKPKVVPVANVRPRKKKKKI